MENQNDGKNSALQDALVQWKSKLLQLDRKNRLIFFKTRDSNDRPTKNQVRIDASNLDAFYSRLCDEEDGLKFPYAERRRSKAKANETQALAEADLTSSLEVEEEEDQSSESSLYVRDGDFNVLDVNVLPLQKILRAIKKQNGEYVEEQGISILYLAFGFLKWIDEADKDGYAPLLLLSCRLEAASLKESVSLVAEADDLLINTTLKEKLRLLGFTLPEFDSEVDNIQSYLAKCDLALCQDSDWSIVPDLHLSTFSFAKIAMWEDLDRFARLNFQTPVLLALSGSQLIMRDDSTENSIVDSQSDSDFEGASLDDSLDTARQFFVLPADFSQIMAVEAARTGNHLIIHGPPGTGKSQTIANLIGTCMADGKSVLFVSEKSAALDVVKRRLEENGLGNFCIDLHGKRASKEAFYQQIKNSVDDERTVNQFKFDEGKLTHYRSQLNTFARALHKTRAPLGSSVYKMHGEYAKVKHESVLLSELTNAEYAPDRLEKSSFAKVSDICLKLAKRQLQFERNSDSPWIPLRPNISEFKAQDNIHNALTSLTTSIEMLSSESQVIAELRDIDLPSNKPAVKKLLEFLQLIENCPGVPTHWLSDLALSRIRTLCKKSREQHENVRDLREKISVHFSKGIPDSDFEEILRKLQLVDAEAATIQKLLDEDWSTRLASNSSEIRNLLDRLKVDITSLEKTLKTVCSSLACSVPQSRTEIQKLVQDLRGTLSLTNVPRRWFEYGYADDIEKTLTLGESLSKSLLEAENSLLQEYNEDILAKISKDMKVRFITDYNSPFAFLLKGKQLTADLNVFNVEHKSYKKHKNADVLPVIDKALEVLKQRDEWQKMEASFRHNLADLYRDKETNWPSLSAKFTNVKSLQVSNVDVEKLFSILSNRNQLQDIEKSLSELSDLVANIETGLAGLSPSMCSAFDISLASARTQLDAAYPTVCTVSEIVEQWSLKAESCQSLKTLINVAQDCADFIRTKTALTAQNEVLVNELGDRYLAEETLWSNIDAALDWAGTYVEKTPFSLNTKIENELANGVNALKTRENISALSKKIENYEISVQKIEALFDTTKLAWKNWESVDLALQKEWASQLL